MLAGHVADRSRTLRPFAHRARERESRDLTPATSMTSWRRYALVELQNTGRCRHVLYVLTNTLGLDRRTGGRSRQASRSCGVPTFSYFAQTTRGMWSSVASIATSSSLTDAAQFAELLLHPPAIVDAGPCRAVPAATRASGSAPCASRIPRVQLCSTASIWRSPPARRSVSSVAPAAARRRSRACCSASPISTPARSRSVARTSRPSRNRRFARR